MKKASFLSAAFVVVLVLGPLILRGQIITTWAGGGPGGGTDGLGDGLNKDSSRFSNPCGAFFDKQGAYYIADQLGAVVRKIDTGCIITLLAGTGLSGYNGDTILATNAELKQPTDVITDSIGNIYIADAVNNRVRKVEYLTGLIYTIAGTGVVGYNGDNMPAINAQLSGPNNLCFDKLGNLYISEYGGHRIRKIDHSGTITTVAGNGILGYSVNGGLADTTTIGALAGVCTDTLGNLYISDGYNARIYKVDASGIITTIAGTSSGYTYNGDNILATTAQINPNELKIDQFGDIFFIDATPNNRIRMIDTAGIIHTAAGNGTATYGGDNGLADSAGIWDPTGLAFDNCGNLYISESGGLKCIRKVAFYPSCSDTLCGPAIDTSHTDSTAFITNISSNSFIRLYPNPAYKPLTITSPNTINNVAIINILGQTLYSKECKSGKIEVDVSGFVSGVYYVRVNGYIQKLVKE